ncbi:MAG: SusC/RagA family TonB-linked outer membrane protein, partial [Fidelibacterota bacterium]
NSARQRYSLRLNVNHRMLDEKLRLGLGINPTFVKRNNTPYNQSAGYYGGVFTNALKMNPTHPVKNEDGSYYEWATTTIRNPVALANEVEDISESIRIFLNATAEYEFIPGLSAKVNLGLDRSGTSRSTYEPRSLPYAAAFGGRADARNNNRQATLFESALNYKADIGASQLEAWAGYTFQEFENAGFGAVAQDFVTDAWSYNNIGGAANFTERPFSFRNKNRLISFLGRVNLNIADKYLISGAIRREGSSRFGEDKKWGLFPSGSVGYRLSDALKVRVSYGVAGNQDIDNYLSLVTLGPGYRAVIGGQAMTGVAATQLANPDLKWEETSQLNLGLDFSFNRDRISGSVDVYTKTTTDLLLEFDVPQPAVVTTRLDNVGEVSNKGIELMLNTVNISTPDLFWRTSLNFAMNRNEVVSLGPDPDKYIMTGNVGGAGLSDVQAQVIIPGEPLGTFLGFRFYGYDAEGQEILIDPDVAGADTLGPLKDGRHILGNAQPDFTFGISNIINYKGIDFRFFIQGVQGVDILNNTRLEYQRPSNVFNGINAFAEVKDDVDAGLDPEAAVAYTDKFIEDGSFIRLQNVTLGYTFSTAMLRNLRLYVSGDNLLILTKYTGYDPEVSTDTGYGLGIDYTNYPRARTFTLGLSVGL